MELINGDCIEKMAAIPNESVDLILTDPPYKVITGGSNKGSKRKRPTGILKKNRQLMGNIPQFKDWLDQCYRVLKNGSHAYFMVNVLNLADLMNAVKQAKFKIHNVLIWEKNNCTPSQYYMKNCEYIIFARKGSAKYIVNIGESKTVHQFKNVIGTKTNPTEKPVELMEFYIENSSQPDQIVLDPFMGSGSVGVACKNLKRDFIGIELDQQYFESAQSRIFGKMTETDKWGNLING